MASRLNITALRLGKRRRGGARRKFVLRASAAVLVILFIISLFVYEKLLDGRVAGPAVNLCASTVEQAISEAADEANWESVTADEGGSYTVDTARLNAALDRFEKELVSRLKKNRKLKVGIPLGSLTSKQFLSGKGPRVTARVFCDYRTECSVRSDVKTVGINQTLYSVVLDVTVDCTLFLRDGTKTVTVTDALILEERLFIGGVPLAGTKG